MVRDLACHLTGLDISPNGMETGPHMCVLLTAGCYVVPVRIGAGVAEFLVDSGNEEWAAGPITATILPS